ncbi:hypothetical protein HMPREF0972_01448 [Actinomyces sp. oral taxon 848 str. F0332]|nr:hypothetical protein HMPREF0972_01448 [Actinomyces sp. oral taxon 848 str. F0332]
MCFIARPSRSARTASVLEKTELNQIVDSGGRHFKREKEVKVQQFGQQVCFRPVTAEPVSLENALL